MTDVAERISLHVDGGVAEVVLSRGEKMNAVDVPMIEELAKVLEELAGMNDLRAVVVHGEGRAFSAGLDMENFAAIAEGTSKLSGLDLAARTHGIANLFQHVCWGWRELAVPVIAAVHGVAFGAGFQIALGADIRLIAPDARMAAMEIKWGIVPDMAGFALLPGLVRFDVASELAYTGKIVTGADAVAMGLATRVADDPLAEARALARDIASRNPDAIRAAKRLMKLSYSASANEILMAESVEQKRLIGSPNQIEAVRAQFEKRPAVYT